MKWMPHKKAMLVFMVIFFMLAGIGGVLSSITTAKGNEDIGPNEVQGKVLSIKTHPFGRGIIEVKNEQTGEVYMFHMGMDTVYEPYRYPVIGETIKVNYFNDRGKLQAMLVEILKSLP